MKKTLAELENGESQGDDDDDDDDDDDLDNDPDLRESGDGHPDNHVTSSESTNQPGNNLSQLRMEVDVCGCVIRLFLLWQLQCISKIYDY